MTWSLVALVLLGDFLVIKKNRLGFVSWLIVDGSFAFINLYNGDLPQASIFALYALMGLYGLYLWD